MAGIAGYDVKSDWGGGLCFYTAPNTVAGGDLTPRMVIDADGNIGIGTTSPQTIFNISKLHDPRLRITGTNDDDTAGIELLENTNSQTRYGAGIIIMEIIIG